MMSDVVYDSLLKRMKEYSDRRPGHSFTISFHGGEPTLIGTRRFRVFVDRARQVLENRLESISLQTNATLLDQNWVEVLRELDVKASVSLDGPPNIHDITRVDHAGRGSHARVLHGIRLLQEHGIPPTVLCVVNPRYRGRQVYRYFRSIGITQMDFLLPDVSHDNKLRLYGGIGTTPVADYLLAVLEAWLEEDDPEIRIRTLEDLLKMLMGGKGVSDCFGNPGSGYLIVETDGSIEANDALRVCANGINRSGLNVMSHGFDELEAGNSLVHEAINGLPLPAACRNCPESSICGGGYLPHRYSKERGFDNPSVWCQDILKLIARMRDYVTADEMAA
jgi:uncharacterized protein